MYMLVSVGWDNYFIKKSSVFIYIVIVIDWGKF